MIKLKNTVNKPSNDHGTLSREIEKIERRLDLNYNLTNKDKQIISEDFCYNALYDFPVIRNMPLGMNGDIDQIVMLSNSIAIVEIKNVNEDFSMYWNWFDTHVLERYRKAYSIAQGIARILGINKIINVLIITRFVSKDTRVNKAVRDYEIKIIETKHQALENKDRNYWVSCIREFFNSLVKSVNTFYKIGTFYETGTKYSNNNDVCLLDSSFSFNGIPCIEPENEGVILEMRQNRANSLDGFFHKT